MTNEEIINYYWDHYPLDFIPLEDVEGPSIHYVVDKNEEEKKKE